MSSQILPDVDVAQAAGDIGDVNDRLLQVQRNFQATNDALASLSAISALGAGLLDLLVKPGMITMTAGLTADVGYLLCDASAVSRTTYAALFARIGGRFGPGDGSTTFNLPDYRGRAPEGAGTGTGGGSAGTGTPIGGAALAARIVGGWKGEEGHVLSVSEMPSHSHGLNPASAFAAGAAVLQGGGTYGYSFGGAASTDTTGGGLTHNNIAPRMACNFQIKT